MELSIPSGLKYPLFYLRADRYNDVPAFLITLGPLYQTAFVHPESAWDLGLTSTLGTPTFYVRAWRFGYSIGLALDWLRYWLKGES